MRYRRADVKGGTYFFTVNLAERKRSLLVGHIGVLRTVLRKVKMMHPFHIDAIVILPDHLHAVWTLPDGDSDLSHAVRMGSVDWSGDISLMDRVVLTWSWTDNRRRTGARHDCLADRFAGVPIGGSPVGIRPTMGMEVYTGLPTFSGAGWHLFLYGPCRRAMTIYVDCILTKRCPRAPDRRAVATHHVPSSGNGGATDRVLETLVKPELIQQGDYGELLAIRFYAETPLTSKFLVVVYREIDQNDGFILTAYFTGQPSNERSILWKR